MSRRGLLLLLIAALPYGLEAHPGSGIVVDRRQHVFFTDTGRGIWEAAPDGTLRLVSASALHWLAAARRDRPVAAGSEFEVVQPEGAELALVLSSDFPCAVAADHSIVYADTRGPTRIVRRQPDGREQVVAEELSAARLPGTPRLRAITGIATAGDGMILVMGIDRESDTYAVHAINARGTVTTRARNFVPAEAERRTVDPGDLCRGLAAAPSGMVYVAVPGARCVVQLERNGAARIVVRTTAPWTPTAVALQGEELYVLEYTDAPAGSDGSDRTVWVPRVRKISRDGTVTTVATVRR